jgi:hypothetical protein
MGGNIMKYQLVEPSKKNIFLVTIEADSNDADYITTRNEYEKEEFDKNIIDELIKLKRKYSGSHKLEDYKDEFDHIDLPYSEWGICHTLTELTVNHYDENGKVWDVKF